MLIAVTILLYVYDWVAVGRKYQCRTLCLLWELPQSLFHVQLGSNLRVTVFATLVSLSKDRLTL